MYDQNDQQGQMGQTQDNNPYSAPIADNNINNFGFNPAQALGAPTADLSTSTSDVITPSAAPVTTVAPAVDDLLEIKQNALQELNPLVKHLDQSPEENFKTTMMMIQASDDQSLIKPAYEAAKKITNEKARAQALLDVVNEINYFTQQNK